jgi:hypothetical protein
MGRLVCFVNISGEDQLKVITTLPGAASYLIRSTPGPGKPYWYWDTIPLGNVVGADFTTAPLGNSNAQVNQQNINAITATPQDVLIYDPPLVPTG